MLSYFAPGLSFALSTPWSGDRGARRGRLGQGRAQLRGQAPQDGGKATFGGRQVIQPSDQAAAVGGREGERDDLAGEQRVDEPAGATLPGMRPPRGIGLPLAFRREVTLSFAGVARPCSHW